MKHPNYTIEGLTIAITHMEQMVNFYSQVFNISFEKREMYGSTLYSGEWGGLKLLFCPAEIARNTAVQNRHQFDILVSDLQSTMELAIKHGGKLMGEVVEDDNTQSIGIYDPDNNSLIFKQVK